MVGDNNTNQKFLLILGGLRRKMWSSRDGHVAKPMDQPAFQRRIDSGSCKYEKLMGNIRGEEWASSLDKIIGGRSNVYARYSIPHLALCYTCETVFPFLVKYFFYLFIYIIS
jgi:hypothetical protein